LIAAIVILGSDLVPAQNVVITNDVLKDKIMGGWAGQLIGCTFGGPTEFQWNGLIIQDYVPIPWSDTLMEWWYDNVPGLYDDIYMDLTFVQVFDEHGLNAPAEEFAMAFAHADYRLWHANQAARYNILNGIMPPESGHWLNNPHAEDLDYQIEADFSGLMSPGMPNTSAEISDKIGHIMNYGDGWYGGVYVGAMYSLAFISDEISYVVEEALKTIPVESKFYQCMADVIKYHKEYPDDWKMTWFKVQEKWGEDVGCPDGVFKPFNIDAKKGDFGKTISISTRAGDDSDCNPASSGGILGTMIGYEKIPDYWKQGIDKVEDRDFKYTTISLKETYDMSYDQAVEVIEKNGGQSGTDHVVIKSQVPEPVRLEIGFKDHYPVERRWLGIEFSNEAEFEFEGIGFSATGEVNGNGKENQELTVEMYIDGELVETSKLPTRYQSRKNTPFWKYQLPDGKHKVHLKVQDPSEGVEISLDALIIYGSEPYEPEH